MTPISTVTIYVALHPWCRDERRDEAVRAAEDGRDGPLPTLEECIGMIPKSVSATSAVEHENKGDDMTKSEQTARPCGGNDPAPSGGEPGGAANGLRTERVTLELPPTPEPSVARVTLEFSGRHRSHPATWPWDLILSGACVVRREPGESVRVVEETHFDDLAQVSMERDTAIREQDECRKQSETKIKRVAPTSRPAETESVLPGEKVTELRDCLLDAQRVAEDAISTGSRYLRERNTAIREREKVRKSYSTVRHHHYLVCDDRDRLRIRVAELERDATAEREVNRRLGSQVASLESKLESVACRAATAGEGSRAAPAASGGGEGGPVAAPPQPRGWLTGEEREAIGRARREAEMDAGLCSDAKNAALGASDATVLAALLARSSPPEVVLPEKVGTLLGLPPHLYRNDEVHAALDAAGVAWKEVG